MDPRQLGLSDEDLAALGYSVGGKQAQGGGEASAGGDAGYTTGGARPTRTSAEAIRVASGARRWFWTTLVLAVAVWGSSSYRQSPDPVPANRPDTVFSSGRAMSQLVEVVRAPRPVGSDEHARVRDYLEDRLLALGLETETQIVSASTTEGSSAVAATVQNVVGRLPGASSSGTVLLTAHYDGIPLSPGAGDDGVGVAAILETLRGLAAGGALTNDIVVLFADAAELGGLGTRVFVESHPWMSDVRLVISVDMRGASGPAWVVEGVDSNGWLLERIASSSRRALAHSLSRAMDGRLGDAGAIGPFEERGLPTMRLVAFGSPEAHHQSLDVAERVSERTLAHQGVQLAALVRDLGMADLDAVGSTGTAVSPGAKTYITLTGLGVVSFPATWSTLTTAALWLVWIALALLFKVRRGDPRRLLAGVGLGAAVVGASAAVGLGATRLLSAAHDELGRLGGAVYNDGFHLTALALVATGLAVLAYGVARRRFDRAALYLGALTLPLALLAWATWRAPFAAAALQPALVVAVATAAIVLVAFPNRLGGRWAWMGTLVLAAATLWLVVPGLEWAAGALTPGNAVVFAVLVATAALLLLPALDWLLAPWFWLTPAVTLVSAAGLVVIALPAVQGEERHPELSSLVLLVDDTMGVAGVVTAPVPEGEPAPVPAAPGVADTLVAGSDSLTTGPAERVAQAGPAAPVVEPDVPRTVRRVAGTWLTVAGPGEAWARSWVAAGAVESRPPAGLLLPEGAVWEVAGAGPAPELPRPVVRLLGTERDASARLLRLVVYPGLGGEMLGLRLGDDTPGAVVTVDGHPLVSAGPAAPRTLEHWGPGSAPVTFDLRLDPGVTTVTFDLIEHHLRPTELLGEDFYERDRSVMPDASTGSDRVVQRVRVSIPLSGG